MSARVPACGVTEAAAALGYQDAIHRATWRTGAALQAALDADPEWLPEVLTAYKLARWAWKAKPRPVAEHGGSSANRFGGEGGMYEQLRACGKPPRRGDRIEMIRWAWAPGGGRVAELVEGGFTGRCDGGLMLRVAGTVHTFLAVDGWAVCVA